MDKIILTLLIIITTITRFYHLGQAPPGLLVDELSYGYNAYSLLLTGTDEWGQRYPLTLQAFGDYKPAGYLYLLLPIVKLFDLTSFSVRLPSAVFGIISVIATVFFVYNLTENKLASFLSGLLLFVSPWHILLSRMAWESNVAQSFFLLGLVFFLYQNKYKLFPYLAAFFLFIPMFFYTAFRLTVPLLIPLLIYYWLKKKKSVKKKLLIFIISFILISVLILPGIISQGGLTRLSQVNIFSQKAIVMYIDEQRSFCAFQGNNLLNKFCYLVWNKPAVYFSSFWKKYLANLSNDFLFLKGDQALFLNIPGYGALYLILLPFFLTGLWFIADNFKKNLNYRFLTFFLLLSPLTPAMAGDPHYVRSNNTLWAVTLISSLGLVRVNNFLKKRISVRILSSIFLLLISINLTVFSLDYFFSYSKKAMAWNEQFVGAFRYLKEIESDYDRIYIKKMTVSPYIYLLFYTKYDPGLLASDMIRSGDQVESVGKYHFTEMQIDSIYCRWRQSNKANTLFVSDNQLADQALFTVKSYNQVHQLLNIYDMSQYEEYLIRTKKQIPYCQI